MKQYPTILPDIRKDVPILAFQKLDGSNIRAEWNRKKGFNKFGTRSRLLGEDEKPIGESIGLIKSKYEKDLNDIFIKNRYDRVVCFFEFFGENSCFGQHTDEPHDVVLFDVDIYKHGLLPARDFLKTFSDKVHIPQVIHDGKANEEFIRSVKDGTLEQVPFEGVVCKGPFDRKLGMPIMFKIKTDRWLEKLRQYCNGNTKLFEQLV